MPRKKSKASPNSKALATSEDIGRAKQSKGDPNDQDIKRRIGSFTGAGEPAQQREKRGDAKKVKQRTPNSVKGKKKK